MEYRTESGLTLSLQDLKGKQYLPVSERIRWFRTEKPEFAIETELVNASENGALFKARIINSEGRLLATAHGSETKQDFKDFLEKAETKAVGRALAALGYGTQFALELDEGERIVDTPQVKRDKPAQNSRARELLIACQRSGRDTKLVLDYMKSHFDIQQADQLAPEEYKQVLEFAKGKD